MNIGIIGSGELGTCLASKFIALGHQVSIANSRGPASIQQLTDEISAKAVTIEEVVKNKEVIVISIPQKNIPDLPNDLFKNLPEGVVVIDTGNYYPNLRDGTISSLEQKGIDSLWVQGQLGIPVVKVFNAIFASSLLALSKPKGHEDRIAIPISSDDVKAKSIVFELVDNMGFDPFDVGTIAQSWKHQTGSSIYCRDINRKEIEKRVEAMTSNWQDMRDEITTRRNEDEIFMKVAYLKGIRDGQKFL